MGEKYCRLTLEKRLYIAEQIEQKVSIRKIANDINCHISSVYREIKRGVVNRKYDPYFADEKMSAVNKSKGAKGIISKELAEIISHLILVEGFSPEQIVFKLQEMNLDTKTPLSPRTIYSAIDKGLIPNVDRKNLHKTRATTHIFSEGMIRIPKWIREKGQINDGDIVSFEICEDEILIKIKK